MAKKSVQTGTTSHRLLLYLTNSVTGVGLTGLSYNSAGLTCGYKRNTDSAAVSVTLANITTLGTYISGGFKEVSSSLCPGVYEFHPPDAAFAASASSVAFVLFGATNMLALPLEIELTAWNNQDAVRGGMTSLPNAAAASSGGLPTVDSTNSVKIQTPIKRNTALNAFSFGMIDASNNPLTGLVVTSQVSIDGAAFGSTVNTATEVGNGNYKINLAAADLNGTVIVLRFSASAAVDNDVVLMTLP